MGAAAFGVAAVATAGLWTAGPASAQGVTGSAYQVQRLPVLPGTTRSEATAMDPSGHWIGGEVDTADGAAHPVLWHDGVLTELSGIPLADAQIAAVGAGGFAAGSGFADGGHSRAFMISGGGYFELPLPAGAVSASASGVSAHGDVAGMVTFADGTRRPVVWPGDRFGTVRELRLPAGYAGSAVGMSADGTAVVQADLNFDQFRSFVFSARGVRTELRPATRGAQAVVQAVADGYAIGFQFDPASGTSSTVRWNLRTHTARVVPLLTSTSAVNSHGTYGGQSVDGTATLVSARGRVIDLPVLAGNRASSVNGLAGDGSAAGFARDAAGTVTAVRWTR